MKMMKEYMQNLVRGITEDEFSVSRTILSLDVSGIMSVEGVNKIYEYNREHIILLLSDDRLIITGKNLVLTACRKGLLHISGNVERIEFERGK